MTITNSDIGVIINSILECQEINFPMEKIFMYVDNSIDETNPDGEGYEWLSDITPEDLGARIFAIVLEIKTVLEERESAAEDEKRRIERLREDN